MSPGRQAGRMMDGLEGISSKALMKQIAKL
jgi:hypothetical protein